MIFLLRQLQEKCREQQKPLYIAFVDLTKAFDTVSRSGLYKILAKIGCPPKLLELIGAFHEGMQSSVNFDGNTSERFEILNGVKQGCVLAAICCQRRSGAHEKALRQVPHGRRCERRVHVDVAWERAD